MGSLLQRLNRSRIRRIDARGKTHWPMATPRSVCLRLAAASLAWFPAAKFCSLATMLRPLALFATLAARNFCPWRKGSGNRGLASYMGEKGDYVTL